MSKQEGKCPTRLGNGAREGIASQKIPQNLAGGTITRIATNLEGIGEMSETATDGGIVNVLHPETTHKNDANDVQDPPKRNVASDQEATPAHQP